MLPCLATSEEILCVTRFLENAFVAIVHFKKLSGIDVHVKPKRQGPGSFMQILLYIILLNRNSTPSKITFPWSHLHLEFSQNFLL